MKFDISEIGEIHCTLNFDEDWYNDYLQENGLSNSQEVFQNYVREQCDYEIEYYDSETFHSMGEYETMTIDEIEENFGSAIARDIFNECMDGREHSFEILAYQNDTVDINNPEELNAAAVKVLRHGGYFKGCRGFILTNGVVVYTESEHNNCTRISGVKGTSHFIELGNIRVLDHSIDICKKPTPQQIKVLWEVLDSYYGDVLYLDLLNKNIGNFSQQYQSCNPERVMNDIISYFNNKKLVFETVKYLLNKELKENMKKNAVKINESTLRQIVAESVKKVLNEYAWASAPSFKELQNTLDKVAGILGDFCDSIPQEQLDEFMKLAGKEWNYLWESLMSLEETVMRINSPRGLSDGDLTFDDLS